MHYAPSAFIKVNICDTAFNEVVDTVASNILMQFKFEAPALSCNNYNFYEQIYNKKIPSTG